MGIDKELLRELFCFLLFDFRNGDAMNWTCIYTFFIASNFFYFRLYNFRFVTIRYEILTRDRACSASDACLFIE